MTLVGAGPGDPDLLTIAAVRALSEPALVIADRLISQEILRSGLFPDEMSELVAPPAEVR